MKTPTQNYHKASVRRDQRPVYIINVITNKSSVSFSTSITDIDGAPGDQTFFGAIERKGIKSTSQSLQIESGTSTVGAFSFTVVDDNRRISQYLRSTYLDLDSISNARVIVYRGYVGLDFSDFLMIGAYVCDSVTQAVNKITFKCSDPTRLANKEIFTEVSGSLFDSLPAEKQSGWIRVVGDLSELSIIDYDHSMNDDFAGKRVGHLLLGSEDDGEVIQFDQVDTDRRRIHISKRGLFNTWPQDWDGYSKDRESGEEEAGEDFSEWFYIRMNAVKLSYLLFTGEYLGTTTFKLPDKLHAGIPSHFMNADSFINIGKDLFDVDQSKTGPILEFYGLGQTSADSINNKEIAPPIGLYFFVNNRGEIELKRDPVAYPGMGGGLILDDRNIISISSITRNPKNVRNIINIKYSRDWRTGEYTRSNSYIFSNSITQYGKTEPKTFEYEGIHLNYSLDPLLQRINKVCTDRYSEELVSIKVKTLPSTHLVEVGDVVYLDINKLPDWGSQHIDLIRSMLVTKTSTNWISGEVTLTLESLIKQPNEIGQIGENSFTDEFYSKGDSLADRLTPGTFKIDKGTLIIESDSTLSGFENIHSNPACWQGDVIIAKGATLKVTKNVQIRALGTISLIGDIDGVSSGFPTWSEPKAGDFFIGPGLIYSQLGVRGWYGDDSQSTPQMEERPVQKALNPVARRIDLAISGISDEKFADIIPKSLRGGNGMSGDDSITLSWDHNSEPPATNQKIIKGGFGGIGGAGLLMVARSGFIKGLEAKINLSGGDGLEGRQNTIQATYPLNNGFRSLLNKVLSGAGGGGGAGSCLCLTESTITDDFSTIFESKYGRTKTPNFDYVGNVQGEISANEVVSGQTLHAYEVGLPGNKARDFSGSAFAMYLANKHDVVSKPKTDIPKELLRLEAYILGNTPPTSDRSRVTIVVNAIPDPNDKNYRYSQFSYRQNGAEYWRPLNNVTSSETRLEVAADGVTWEFLATPTSKDGKINPKSQEVSVTTPTSAIDKIVITDISVDRVNTSVTPATAHTKWTPVGADKFPLESVLYEVQHRPGTTGVYNSVGTTSEIELVFSGVVQGINSVRVRAIPPNGIISNWATTSFNASIAKTPIKLEFNETIDQSYWGILTWEGETPIYEVSVVNEFKELMFTMSTTVQDCFIPMFDPGTYSLSVRGLSGSTYSTRSTISHSIGGVIPPFDVAFAWQPNNAVSSGVLSWSNSDIRVTGYEIRIEDENNTKVAELSSSALSVPVPFLTPGIYQSRVRSIWRTFASGWTTYQISISAEIVEITNLKYVDDNEPGSSGVLTWEGGENYFDVRIEDIDGKSIVETGVGSRTYRVGLLQTGEYTASVRARGTFSSSDWLEANIVVEAPSKPLDLEFDTSSNIFGQDGILTWKAPPGNISGYLVEIVSDDSKLVVSNKTTSTNYPIAGLPPGLYEVSVYALAALGDSKSENTSIDIQINDLAMPMNITVIEQLNQFGAGYISSAIVSWESGDPRSDRYDLEFKNVNDKSWTGGYSGMSLSATVSNLEPGDYIFRVRARFGGLLSGWREKSIGIRGHKDLPPRMTGFQLRALTGQFAMLTWDPVTDIGVMGGGTIQVRHTYRTDASATWEASAALTDVLPGNATFVSVPLLEGTYLIKCQTITGLWSENAAAVKSNMNANLGYNRYAAIIEPPGWKGEKNKATIDESGDLKFYETNDNDEPPYYITQNPLDLGAVFTVRLSLDVDGSAFIEDLIDDRLDPIDEWKAFDGAAPGGLSLRYDVSTTDDNPESKDATWSEWQQFLVGEFRARAFKIRVSLWNAFDFSGGGMASLKLMADVPERTESGRVSMEGVDISIKYEVPFMRKPIINITQQDMLAGDHHKIVFEDESGFVLRLSDHANKPRKDSVDWVAIGYGTKEI